MIVASTENCLLCHARVQPAVSLVRHPPASPICRGSCAELTQGLENSQADRVILHPQTGHLHQADGDLVTICWTRCEAAAKLSTALLSRYRETFSLSRAPYLIVGRAVMDRRL